VRAAEIVERRGPEGAQALHAALRAMSPSPADLVEAMRGPGIVTIVNRACRTIGSREDLGLLIANPWEPVGEDEIDHAPIFDRLGLIERVDDAWHVNVDMALALVASTPWEFGFAATLIARLGSEDTKTLSRAVEVGPRPHPIDFVVEAATAAIEPERVRRHVAHLTAAERAPLRAAITLGELPDEVSGASDDDVIAHVTLDPGGAGQRGLLFWIAWPDRENDARPLVPLELQTRLEEWLDEIPPAPDVERVRSRKQPTRRTTSRRTSSTTSRPGVSTGRGGVPRTEPPSTDRLAAVAAKPLARSQVSTGSPARMPAGEPTLRGPMTTTGGSRAIPAASVCAAAALVDLESPRLANLARQDAELGRAVLEVVADTMVVLREGVDAADWAERCAIRLRFGGS
jgi:hypothetical protein